MSKRVYYFDFIRGLMILWVLITHISLNYGLLVFGEPVNANSPFMWLSFFMTPFYVFSGWFFNTNRSYGQFVTNKARKLLIPYLTFTLFGLLIYLPLKGLSKAIFLDLFWSFISVLSFPSNTPCWFFISLFLCNCIYYPIRNLSDKRASVIIFSFFCIAYFTHNHSQFFGYGNVCLGLVYMHIGNLLNKYKVPLNRPVFFFIAVSLYIAIGLFNPQRLAFVLNLQTQGEYILNLFFSSSACFVLWFLAMRIPIQNIVARYIIFLGTNSLVLFASHRVVLNYIYDPIILALYPNYSYLTYLIVGLVVIILVCHLLDNVLRKFAPKLLGV